MGSPEVIDLTQPEVIELDSDGEEVDARPPTNSTNSTQMSQEDGVPQLGQQDKKKRKRKRRKAGTGNQDDEVEGTTISAEVSRPQSPSTRDEQEILEVGMKAGQTREAGRSRWEKRSLADRLSGPAQGGSRSAANGEERKQDRKDKERMREGERDREGERERQRERDRRRSRSPRRERNRDRDREPHRRPRSRERDRDKRTRDKPPKSDAPLFFEDVTPAEIPVSAQLSKGVAGPSKLSAHASSSTLSSEAQAVNGLLLPTHVSVAEGAEAEALELGPLKVPTVEGGSDQEDYIDYLDYGDNVKAGMVRYWELDKLEAEEAKASKAVRVVCKKCGAEGEHKTYECTVLICLTCGARNEHPTRGCPISKVCFTCGMKGHINKTCPNRGRPGAYQGFHDCDRCGARSHQTNECPTLWRIYKYVEDEDRQEILRTREGKRMLSFGEGGEGYISTDEWCYNCGESGHLGDDCPMARSHAPDEPSAFSIYNILSGPFSADAPRPSKRAPRDWETASAFADGYGATLPTDVGKQGRRKERERLGKARQLQDAEDDQDDWFGGARPRARGDARDNRGAGRNGSGGGGGSGRSKANGKIKFNFSGSSLGGGAGGAGGGERDGKRQRTSYNDLPMPSRETDTLHIHGAARKQSYSSTSSKDRHDRHDRHDPRDRHSRERNHNHYEKDSRGPRYRGGYR